MSRWYGSFQNRLNEGAVINAPKLEKGMGVTELLYTDRNAYFVVGWSKETTKDGWAKEIYIQRAKVKCLDWYAGNWQVLGVDENYKPETIKVTRPFGKCDKYPQGGRAYTSDGTRNGTFFNLGYADEYRDPSF